MKTRIMAATVLIPVLLLIVLVAPKEVAAVVIGILMATGLIGRVLAILS